MYENVKNSVENVILFTDQGLYWWRANNWIFLKYAEMAASEWPEEGKTNAHTLMIRMKSGEKVPLPVWGGTEFTRDLFSVMTFLDRILVNNFGAVLGQEFK